MEKVYKVVATGTTFVDGGKRRVANFSSARVDFGRMTYHFSGTTKARIGPIFTFDSIENAFAFMKTTWSEVLLVGTGEPWPYPVKHLIFYGEGRSFTEFWQLSDTKKGVMSNEDIDIYGLGPVPEGTFPVKSFTSEGVIAFTRRYTRWTRFGKPITDSDDFMRLYWSHLEDMPVDLLEKYDGDTYQYRTIAV